MLDHLDRADLLLAQLRPADRAEGRRIHNARLEIREAMRMLERDGLGNGDEADTQPGKRKH